QNVPTVCGLCPVGCNVHATIREGKVKRILSRNHPEVDEGWLCDKGRFAFTHLYARDRIADPLKRVRRRGFDVLSWDAAIDEAERMLRAAEGRIVTALSGSETVEHAYALGRLLRVGLRSHTAVLASELGFAGKPGSGAFHLPCTPNGRGAADAWAAASDEEGPNPEPIGLLVVSGDEAAADPGVRALAERAEQVLVTSMFQGLAAGWADLVLPGTSYLERDGTYVNLEGRLQRLRRTVIPPAPDELAWISKLAERFGVEVPPYASAVFAELSERIYDGLTFGEVGEQATLRTRSEAPPAELPPEPPAVKAKGLE